MAAAHFKLLLHSQQRTVDGATVIQQKVPVTPMLRLSDSCNSLILKP
jgi:hypothetical protein